MNTELVRNGFAWHYQQYRNNHELAKLEINASNATYDKANITACTGDTELSSGTDSVKFTLEADDTVLPEYNPEIFRSDPGVTRYSIVIKTTP